MKKANRYVLTFAILLSANFFWGCDSKVVESSPGSTGVGLTLDERLELKVSMDEFLVRVERGARGIQRILDLFRTLTGSENSFYSVTDFILDSTQALKDSFPSELEAGVYRRESQMTLNLPDVSEECRHLETRLTTTRSAPVVSNQSDKLVYAFKGCGTNGEFISVLEVTFRGNDLQLVTNQENLAKIADGILTNYSENSINCSISFSTQTVVNAFNCSNLELRIQQEESFTDYALIDSLRFDPEGEQIFTLRGRLFKDDRRDSAPGQLTANPVLIIGEDGIQDFALNPVARTTPAN